MFKKFLVSCVIFFTQTGLTAEITLADRAEILETIASYGQKFDRRDGKGFANLFGRDGSWHAFPNKSPKALITLSGREEIEAFANDRQGMFERVGIETKHFMLNSVLTVRSAVEVEASAMALILWQRPSKGYPLPRLAQSGYYDYVLRKSDEGWKFHHVKVLTSGFYKPEEIYSDLK